MFTSHQTQTRCFASSKGDSGFGELGHGAESVFYEEQGVQYEEDGSDEEVDEEGVELVDESERAQESMMPSPSGPHDVNPHRSYLPFLFVQLSLRLRSRSPAMRRRQPQAERIPRIGRLWLSGKAYLDPQLSRAKRTEERVSRRGSGGRGQGMEDRVCMLCARATRTWNGTHPPAKGWTGFILFLLRFPRAVHEESGNAHAPIRSKHFVRKYPDI